MRFEESFPPNNIKATSKDLEYSLKNGYYPIGCSTLKAVMDHEIGHHINFMINAREKAEIINIFKLRTK